jgi:hypothetical protein
VGNRLEKRERVFQSFRCAGGNLEEILMFEHTTVCLFRGGKNKVGGYMEVFPNEKGSEKLSEPLVFLGAEDGI